MFLLIFSDFILLIPPFQLQKLFGIEVTPEIMNMGLLSAMRGGGRWGNHSLVLRSVKFNSR